MQHMQKTRTLRKNVLIATTTTSKEQRTIPTTTKPTNKKRQKYQRRGGRNNSTTTRRGRGRRINRPRINNVYNRTYGRLEKDQSDRKRIQRN